MKWYGMSNNPAKYEVLIKQYLRSILDISASLNATVKLYTQNLSKSLVLFQFFLGLVKELKRLGFNSLQRNNLETELCNWSRSSSKVNKGRKQHEQREQGELKLYDRVIQENRAHQNKYVSETRRQERKEILTAIDNKIKEKKQKKLKQCSKS